MISDYWYNGSMNTKNAIHLTEAQKDQVRTWIRAGYTAQQIEGMAKNQGFFVSANNVQNTYIPYVRREFKDYIDQRSPSASWFNKEFRAQKAAEIADLLFNDIMSGKMYAEEVTVKEDRRGDPVTTTKPIYFAGMIKNWKDLVDTIANELGQRRQAVDVNFNKNQNVNLSFLVDKIYQQDTSVDKQIEGAEIIDLPSPSDFADDKGFLAIVGDQPEEIKEVVDTEDHGEDIF